MTYDEHLEYARKRIAEHPPQPCDPETSAQLRMLADMGRLESRAA